MTSTTNARIAGSTFLLYIVFGVTEMVISGRASGGEGTAGKLASMAQHATDLRVSAVLGLLTGFVALALAVALYALTRDEDRDLALLALVCRVGEGLIAGIFLPSTLGLLLVVAPAAAGNTPEAAAASMLGAFLLAVKRWTPVSAATFFAVGSTISCWLLLSGRMIPRALAWLGVAASVLLVVALPLQVAGFFSGAATQLVWIPMAAFEIPLALWLLIRGVAPPRGGHRLVPGAPAETEAM
jgi:hypothetical protein